MSPQPAHGLSPHLNDDGRGNFGLKLLRVRADQKSVSHPMPPQIERGKAMWKKSEPSAVEPEKPNAQVPRNVGTVQELKGPSCASIGPTITIQGEVIGDEDLVIQGRIEGRVDLRQHKVTVGPRGRVRADIHGCTVIVEGEVEGNLTAEELVVVRSSGRVRGDIIAPRVTLEDGAGFKGNIDMEGSDADRSSKPTGFGFEESELPSLPQDLGAENDLVIGRILS